MQVRPKCRYCNIDADLKTGAFVYPHRKDLYDLNFWVCSKCGAYSGCHKRGSRLNYKGTLVVSDGTFPLGTLANESLRKLRTKAHRLFDPIWRSGRINRSKAYAKMATYLEIPVTDCHIAYFDEEMCSRFIDALSTVFTD